MNIYRIAEITLKPMIVLAHDMDDAVNIFAYELVMGLGHRPDADFSVVRWRPKPAGPAQPVAEWAAQGWRGVVWSVDAGRGWEMHQTKMVDPGDAHVLAAALKVRASTIVTDNISDFPEAILVDLDLEARSTADTIELDPGRAIAAIRKMRERFARPSLTADDLLLRMDAVGLPETVSVVGPYRELL